MRAFRGDVARQYLHVIPDGFSHVTTITMAFLANGYSVKYIPIEYSAARREVEVPLVEGHEALHHAGGADVPVVQPAAGVPPARRSSSACAASTKMIVDWSIHDFRLATNTLLILFAAFQLFAIGLLADLFVRLSKPSAEVDPAAL